MYNGTLTLLVLVAESARSHIGQLNGLLGTSVHEPIAASGVEFRGSDNLCQFLHIRGFDINDIEALVLDVQVPQVDPKIIATDEGLSIAVYGDTVNVIGMGVGVGASGNGGDDGVMVGHAWEL